MLLRNVTADSGGGATRQTKGRASHQIHLVILSSVFPTRVEKRISIEQELKELKELKEQPIRTPKASQ